MSILTAPARTASHTAPLISNEPAVEAPGAPAPMATTFAELNAMTPGAFRRWEAEYRRRVAIVTGGASRTFGGSACPAVDQAHRLVFDGQPAGSLDAACVAAAESVLHDPIGAAASLKGREAVMRWVAAAGAPTYSDDPQVEAALNEARACLFPASDRYKADMSGLADRTDRVAAIMAEPESAGDGASTAASWPARVDRDRWSVSADPADDDEAAGEYAAWSKGLPYAPTDEDYAWLAAESAAADALAVGLVPADGPAWHATPFVSMPLLCGGSPEFSRPLGDAKPIRVRTPRRTNVGSEYSDFDQLVSKGCV